MMRRLLAVWHARNLEFLRDRGTLVFTLLLPLSIIVGMGFIFGGPPRPLFKVGVLGGTSAAHADPFVHTRYVQFLPVHSAALGLHALRREQIDLLLAPGTPPRYWVNTDSPKGYIAERLLLAADPRAQRLPVHGRSVRYLDWLFPGILGMNLMFSCLFGVGYVVLRYRQSGFLKRLNATPLTAFEFLSAQVLSRLTIIVLITTLLYAAVGAMIHFHNAGSVALLLLITVLGALSMIALGLTVAARFASEELVNGLLNLLTWPMMLLSGVWFSLAGSPRWVRWVADALPLTQMLHAAREVMLYGAGIGTVAPSLMYLAAVTLVFLGFGAWSFKWRT
jgi:ABC-type multidrug transport system permease subunit